MVRFILALAMAPALFGQLTTDILSKAPPPVDEALRARISEFYQAHVDGTPRALRKAEELVAEDSKDAFYVAGKPKYLSYEIRSIDYSENFTRAKVLLLCTMMFPNPMFANKPVPVPTVSRWKVVDGKWYFYLDPEALKATPMGNSQGSTPGAPGGALAMPQFPTEAEARAKLKGVKADKDSVRIDPTKPFTDHVNISNGLSGSVSLVLTAPKMAGLEIVADKTALKSGEQASVTIRYTPAKKPAAISGDVVAKIEVDPTGQVLPIRLEFVK